MNKWQPIETAPRDGSVFLGYWPDSADPYGVISSARFSLCGELIEYTGFYAVSFLREIDWPEYWMPAPEPPK